MRDEASVAELVGELTEEVLRAPADPHLPLVEQGLDSLGAADLIEALQRHGFHADYEALLGGADLTALVASLRETKPAEPPRASADSAALTGPQRIWLDLERRGWGDWANVSLCLSMPASTLPAALLPAMLQALCDANDALRLVLEPAVGVEGGAVQRALPEHQLPVRMQQGPSSERDAMRMFEAFEAESVSPFEASARALVLASPDPNGRHRLCLTMHHVFADRIGLQALADQLRDMVRSRTTTVSPPPAARYVDVAAAREASSVASDARPAPPSLARADLSAERRVPALVDPGSLDLGDLPASASFKPSEAAALEEAAKKLGVTAPLLLHAVCSVVVERLTTDTETGGQDVEPLVCHVASNRERDPSLRALAGCLDTSVPVAVRVGTDDGLRALCRSTREAFAEAYAHVADQPRGQWLKNSGEDRPSSSEALFERIPHVNIIRARSRADDVDVREHAVRRVQRTRWGLLLRVVLPPTDGEPGGEDGMQLTAFAEDRMLAIVATHVLADVLRDLLDTATAEALEGPILARVDRAIEQARFAASHLRRTRTTEPRVGDAFIYEKLIARQRRWYAHDARFKLRRDDRNRFVSAPGNPFPFTQLDKLGERRFLEKLGAPLPRLLHVIAKEDIEAALPRLLPELPKSFAVKPVGA